MHACPNSMDLREMVDLIISNSFGSGGITSFRIENCLKGSCLGHRSRSRYDNERSNMELLETAYGKGVSPSAEEESNDEQDI